MKESIKTTAGALWVLAAISLVSEGTFTIHKNILQTNWVTQKVAEITLWKNAEISTSKWKSVNNLTEESTAHENKTWIPLWENEVAIALISWNNSRLLEKLKKHEKTIAKTEEQKMAINELKDILQKPLQKSDHLLFLRLVHAVFWVLISLMWIAGFMLIQNEKEQLGMYK